jgi:hypothetical protein
MIQHATQTALLKRPLATQYVVDDEDWDETGKTSDQFSPLKLSHHPFRFEVELSYFPHVV